MKIDKTTAFFNIVFAIGGLGFILFGLATILVYLLYGENTAAIYANLWFISFWVCVVGAVLAMAGGPPK